MYVMTFALSSRSNFWVLFFLQEILFGVLILGIDKKKNYILQRSKMLNQQLWRLHFITSAEVKSFLHNVNYILVAGMCVVLMFSVINKNTSLSPYNFCCSCRYINTTYNTFCIHLHVILYICLYLGLYSV